jgi:hypothetical protein
VSPRARWLSHIVLLARNKYRNILRGFEPRPFLFGRRRRTSGKEWFTVMNSALPSQSGPNTEASLIVPRDNSCAVEGVQREPVTNSWSIDIFRGMGCRVTHARKILNVFGNAYRRLVRRARAGILLVSSPLLLLLS